jgi:hypothetical protein
LLFLTSQNRKLYSSLMWTIIFPDGPKPVQRRLHAKNQPTHMTQRNFPQFSPKSLTIKRPMCSKNVQIIITFHSSHSPVTLSVKILTDIIPHRVHITVLCRISTIVVIVRDPPHINQLSIIILKLIKDSAQTYLNDINFI